MFTGLTKRQEAIVSALGSKPIQISKLADKCGVTPTAFSRSNAISFDTYGKALTALIERGIVKETKIGKRKAYYISDNDIPHQADETAEEKLIESIKQYLETKKAEMLADYDTIVGEREYYKNLCEKYKAECEGKTVGSLLNIFSK